MVVPNIHLAHQSMLVKGKNTLIAGILLMFLSVFLVPPSFSLFFFSCFVAHLTTHTLTGCVKATLTHSLTHMLVA